jgi:hypothetical protein
VCSRLAVYGWGFSVQTDIDAISSIDPVASATAVEDVISLPTEHGVIVGAGIETVGGAQPGNDVMAIVAEGRVSGRAADDPIGARVAHQRIAAGAAFQHVVAVEPEQVVSPTSPI